MTCADIENLLIQQNDAAEQDLVLELALSTLGPMVSAIFTAHAFGSSFQAIAAKAGKTPEEIEALYNEAQSQLQRFIDLR